jgi:hypothetical protein
VKTLAWLAGVVVLLCASAYWAIIWLATQTS